MTRRDTLQFLGLVFGTSVTQSIGSAQSALTLASLTDSIMVLTGAGGNITIARSPEGLLLVDAGLPNTADAVMTKVKEVAALPVQHLINTHWHSDHTGGNVVFGKSGTHIMTQEHCAQRLAETQHMTFFKRDVPPLAAAGQPKETFREGKSLKFAGQSIDCQYYPPAHTDTDVTIHFKEADVYATGDLFFNGMYPFIDYSSGGSIEGMIRNSAAILKVVENQTRLVPGHGPIGNKAQLQQFHDMLTEANVQISKLVANGTTEAQVLSAAPTAKFDPQWGGGVMKPNAWISMLYQGKTQKTAKAA